MKVDVSESSVPKADAWQGPRTSALASEVPLGMRPVVEPVQIVVWKIFVASTQYAPFV